MRKKKAELIPTISLEHGEGEVVGAYLPMNRMKREIPKHSNSLDRIRALENENKRLEEENKNLKEKIKRLEFDVDAWHQLKLLLEGEIERLKKENEELKEYKSMYEGLC